MYVTAFFAGLLAMFYSLLAFRVIRSRRSARIAFGDGGDKATLRAIRVHANFSEYVPFTLLLMALAEWQSVPAWILILMGTMLTTGRFIHAYGVTREPEITGSRTLGMGLTFAALIVLAALNLALGIYQAL
ncbi:MAPEG family protein [Hoeflea prorocentri]|uniref:MAPEG family protein n=1 Tax=Hoeflea prorocentri TaxID=1922333 RepID=A0A9X3ZHQ2_9HYPH|nr:MAPEG family protein [Hoeflea prorocentri]MCY6381061.1 MAPEG family protein [Hoeflea prorocentri]MDA5398861.1 MAPEG family protein [Hoeflea prorocentri]